jgi:molecular chaperone DnaK
MYALGIDLGTTFTGAATWRDGRAEVASLGSRASVIPSVVLLRDDETVLTGEAANRRGFTEPHRVAREFKRRFGDTTPILLGGAPYSPEALMGRLLRSVIDDVATREGGPATRICISHPANWGPYKRDLVDQVVRLADVDLPIIMTTEPEAAAVYYAQQQRVDPGAVVAVYDLGGGTFDAAVLRKTDSGFEILGQPEGIERLGGIDFDAAVFSHVRQALQGKLEELDEDDPTAVAAVARLREECVAAKEALSSDTDASIPVLLPNVSTEVRITRAEFEAMVRPTLHSSIEALRRALRSAEVAPEDLDAVLLVGGSSRIPLVAQLVGAELGRPVAVDAHPKHTVALGAAWLAGGAHETPAVAAAPGAVTPLVPMATPGMDGPSTSGGAEPPVAAVAAVGSGEPVGPVDPIAPGPADVPTDVVPGAAPAEQPTALIPAVQPEIQQPPGAQPPPGSRSHVYTARSRRPLLAMAGVLAILLIAGGAVWAVTRGDTSADDSAVVGNEQTAEQDEPESTEGETSDEGDTSDEGTTSEAEETGTEDDESTAEEEPLPADEECTEAIMSNERWVCLTSAALEDDQLVIHYDVEWAGSVPNISNGFHLHIWGSDGTSPPDHIMGSHAGDDRGNWVIKDDLPAVLTAQQVIEVVGDQPKVCARIANSGHALVPDQSGGFGTGNCVPIDR